MHPVLQAHLDATPQDVRDWAFGTESGWDSWALRPRVLRDVSDVSTALTLYGGPLATPVGVAPTAAHATAHPDAEEATARGAADAGALYVVSSRASVPVQPKGPWWWQSYVLKDRARTLADARRAAAQGATAIVLTGDTPYLGTARRPDLGTLEQDPTATLSALEGLSWASGLPVLVKGVLRADDAVACVEAGAAGVVVSNHGGRQLPRAVAPSYALEEVASAVDVPVLVDGGIRSGADVLTALALGATAVLVGRPVLWGLAADGADGVRDCLTALTDDLRHVLGLAGCRSLADVDRSLVVRA